MNNLQNHTDKIIFLLMLFITVGCSTLYKKNSLNTNADFESVFWAIEDGYKDDRVVNHVASKNSLTKFLSKNPEHIQAKEILLTYRSFLGEQVDYDDIEAYEHDQIKQSEMTLDSLVNLISDERVVMFNENHLRPACRQLLSLLLGDLYEKGFNTLALEGLFDDEIIKVHGYPNARSGMYTRETQMANLIRNARHIGFRVIGYDDVYQSQNREIAQAENLISKSNILDDHNAKLLVLAGGGHIDEKITASNDTMMGYYFKKLAKIDPFTINQVKYLPIHAASHSNKIYFVNNEGSSKNDLYLVNDLDGSTIHLQSINPYKRYSIPLYEGRLETNLQLTLYRAAEFKQDRSATPILADVNRIDPTIIDLPEGEYVYIILDESGRILQQDFL